MSLLLIYRADKGAGTRLPILQISRLSRGKRSHSASPAAMCFDWRLV